MIFVTMGHDRLTCRETNKLADRGGDPKLHRRVSMDHEKREYMIGHALPGMGDTCGDMAGLFGEIIKLPQIKA
jgi:hypothetical protein